MTPPDQHGFDTAGPRSDRRPISSERGRAAPWRGIGRQRGLGFSFLVLGDRTGMARPGVFERAVEATNLLAPDLVVMVGDMIEGYTTDSAEMAHQWDEFEALIAPLEAPFFPTFGNHDLSNPVMSEAVQQRFGNTYYAFRYRGCLFLFLNTQDPAPPAPAGITSLLDAAAELRRLQQDDPVALAERIAHLQDWESTMPASMSHEQMSWATRVIADNDDADWTFLFMHMPAWQGVEHPGLSLIREALGDRGYTMFAGHAHNYERRVIAGHDHVRLGPTGGAWSQVRDHGNFDQITLVHVDSAGPRIANLAVEGIFGLEGGLFEPTSWRDSHPIRD